jgi:hypothetical protein
VPQSSLSERSVFTQVVSSREGNIMAKCSDLSWARGEENELSNGGTEDHFNQE